MRAVVRPGQYLGTIAAKPSVRRLAGRPIATAISITDTPALTSATAADDGRPLREGSKLQRLSWLAAGDLLASGVDFIDDGMTDNAREKALNAWLAEPEEIGHRCRSQRG